MNLPHLGYNLYTIWASNMVSWESHVNAGFNEKIIYNLHLEDCPANHV
jgi:hypothetical protein